jgi:uroporphyrinogen decarboxylase
VASPDFERFKKAVMCRGEPDRVPLGEAGIDIDVKEAFLKRPIRTLEDEVEFWYEAGYDYVPLPVGMRIMFRMGFSSDVKPELGEAVSGLLRVKRYGYGVIKRQERQRNWAESLKGIVTNDSEFESFPWPDVHDFNYSRVERIADILPKGMKLIIYQGWIFTPTWMLMGFVTFCLALKENPDFVARLFRKVGEIQFRIFEHLMGYDHVGGVWMPDDIAYTEGLMVNPDVLHEHVFPWYKRMGEICKSRDLPYIYHSDGDLREVIEDLIDAGFNGIHPIEPKAMDIVELKRKYGGRLSLIGNIDLGYTLTRGTPEEVEEEVRERIRTVAPGGGYCVGSSNSVTEYVPLENYNAMREATFKYGKYPISI